MGELDFKFVVVKSDDVFFIPDNSAYTIRMKINEYFNPDIQEVAIVGIPLTDKIFIEAMSTKVKGSKTEFITITDANSDLVKQINTNIFTSSFNKVGTSDELFLKNFVLQLSK